MGDIRKQIPAGQPGKLELEEFTRACHKPELLEKLQIVGRLVD